MRSRQRETWPASDLSGVVSLLVLLCGLDHQQRLLGIVAGGGAGVVAGEGESGDGGGREAALSSLSEGNDPSSGEEAAPR